MKKTYQSPEFDLVKFRFERTLGEEPGEHEIGVITHSDPQGFGEAEGEL